MPQIVALEGAAMLAFAPTPGIAMAVGSLILVASAWYIGKRFDRALASATRRADSPRETTSGLQELCTRAFEVWSRQLKTSRRTADKAVARLSAVFGEIVDKLEKTLAGSMSAMGGGDRKESDVLRTLDRSRDELTRIIVILKDMEGARDVARDQVGLLAGQLKEMAGNVGQMAMKLRLTALNATIEAAHAGAAGKVFATVFGEIRGLAADSEAASARMTRQLDSMSLGMMDGGNSKISEAEEAVRGVLERFGALAGRLTESVGRLENEHERIRDMVAEALVGLQFQDRVSQIVSHVHSSLDELGSRIAAGGHDAFDVRAWVSESSRAYSMSEEFANLESARGPAARKQHEVTFF